MKLEEAIKFNGALRKDLIQKGMPTYAEAVGLGNEALKAVLQARQMQAWADIYSLPGETKE